MTIEKPVAIVTSAGATNELRVVSSHEDAAGARKALRHLEPGDYRIVKLMEDGIKVSPPPEPSGNLVARGDTVIHRTPKGATAATEAGE